MPTCSVATVRKAPTWPLAVTMRGLTDFEHQELAGIAQESGERTFHGPTLDLLESQGRIERFDIESDGAYRIRATEAGALLLSTWPLFRHYNPGEQR